MASSSTNHKNCQVDVINSAKNSLQTIIKAKNNRATTFLAQLISYISIGRVKHPITRTALMYVALMLEDAIRQGTGDGILLHSELLNEFTF